MLIAFIQLLVCQLIGEVIAQAFDSAILGAVIGISLLLVALLYGKRYQITWRPQPKGFCIRCGSDGANLYCKT